MGHCSLARDALESVGNRRQSHEEDHWGPERQRAEDPDTSTRKASSEETTTQPTTERVHVTTAETEAEGAPPTQKTRTTVPESTTVSTFSAATTAPTATSTTHEPATALVERVRDDIPQNKHRIAALLVECDDTSTSEADVAARQKRKSKTNQSRARSDATARPLQHDGWRVCIMTERRWPDGRQEEMNSV